MNRSAMMEIEKILDKNVRPELIQHGGEIRLVKLEDNILHVQLIGHCHNCPSAEFTMENTVRTVLRDAFPGLQEIRLVTGVSDEMISTMKEIMSFRREGRPEVGSDRFCPVPTP